MNNEQDNGQGVQPGGDGKPLTLSDRVRSLKLPERGRGGGHGGSSWFAWVLVLLFAGTSAGFAYAWWSGAGAGSGESQAKDDKTGGTSQAAAPGDTLLDQSGFIIPVRKPQISPKVGGQVVRIYIEEGQLLEEGQIIADIDPRKYEFEEAKRYESLKQAKAELRQVQANYQKMQAGNRPEEIASSRAQLEEAEEATRQARREADRATLLGRATSPEEIERLQSKLTTALKREESLRQQYEMMRKGFRQEDIAKAQAELSTAQRKVAHARAAYDEAVYDLQNTRVVAPFTGVVLSKNAEVGDMVLPNVPSNGLKASLVELANLQELEVDVDVSERNLPSVFKGQKCEVRAEAFPNRVYQGVVTKLMPVANRSKASVSVRVGIRIPERDFALRPEMRARVRFLAPDVIKAGLGVRLTANSARSNG
jgi:HlyD family secretion protein